MLTKNQPNMKSNLIFMLLSYIYLLLFVNGFKVVVAFALFNYDDSLAIFMGVPKYLIPYSFVLSILNIFGLILLKKQKKAGFIIFAVGQILEISLSIYIGIPVLKSCYGIGGCLLLWTLLQLGGENNIWKKMTWSL